MTTTFPSLPTTAQQALVHWERLWNVPGLTDSLSVSFSSRLRTSLGRARPSSGRVILHRALLAATTSALLEVLCHEAAHVAVARLARTTGNRRARPHGPEWKELMSAAGFLPRRTVPREAFLASLDSDGARAMMSASTRDSVLHTCPVCHAWRRARRVVRAWRCAACVANGLSGNLVITRVRPKDSERLRS